MSVEILVLLFFASLGRVAGPEAGPERKWQGLCPALSIAGAATVHSHLDPTSAIGQDPRIAATTVKLLQQAVAKSIIVSVSPSVATVCGSLTEIAA